MFGKIIAGEILVTGKYLEWEYYYGIEIHCGSRYVAGKSRWSR